MKVQVIKLKEKETSYRPVGKYGDITLTVTVKKNKQEPISSEVVEMTESELKEKQNE